MEKVFERNGVRVTAMPRRYENRRQWTRTTRVYGALDLAPQELEAQQQWAPPAAIMVPAGYRTAPEGTYSPEVIAEFDRVVAGYRKASRQLVRVARERLQAVLDSIPELGGARVREFSRKAGCFCGCSPGFVLETRVEVEGKRVDLYIDILK